jgi:hypothetical protein
MPPWSAAARSTTPHRIEPEISDTRCYVAARVEGAAAEGVNSTRATVPGCESERGG